MSQFLTTLSISGYKSIRELNELELGALTVLIGANGAGKSNFVDFFRLLRALADGRLQHFIADGGGPDSYPYRGPRHTPSISAKLMFQQNGYRFRLKPQSSGVMTIESEGTLFTGSDIWKDFAEPCAESRLGKWKDSQSNHRGQRHLTSEKYTQQAIADCMVYHFHDTSMTAPMRREGEATNNIQLAADAGNLAAFLAKLRKDNSLRYENLLGTIRSVAPFFDDFILEPFQKGPKELIKLDWKQRGGNAPMQPWQMSDGTLRFIGLTTALMQPKPPSTIVIDEPELGLHPAALHALANLIKETSDKTQVIIATQSTVLLDEFLPEHILIARQQGGESHYERLPADALKEWLDDYRLGDLMRKNVIDSAPSHV